MDWGALAILGGYLWILNQTGFGLLQDYIFSFWGVAEKLTPAAIMLSLRAGTPKPA